MSSADEEDIHQCGRCKAVFHSIDEYFTHKKAKSCRKRQKSGPKVLFEDVNDDGNSRERSTLNTPKYVPSSSSLYDSFLELVDLNSNDGFLQDGASKDGLMHKTSAFMGFSFDDSKDAFEMEKTQKKDTKKKHLSTPVKKNTGSQKGRPKKVVEIACTICDFKAVYQRDMDKHMLTEHKISRYTCQHCNATFKSKSHLNDHLQVCFLKSSEPIPSCSAPMAIQRGAGKGHTLDENGNHKERDFECQDCGISCASFNEITKHVKDNHENISPGICRFCGRWFPTKNKLFKHLSTVVHPEISEAEMKIARTEISQLKIHWKVPKHHTSNMDFSCKKCHINFDKKQDLMTHNQQNHATEKNYCCENCGESFRTQRLYLSHLSTHGIHYFEPGFKCPTCGKRFHQKVHVCRHIETLHTPSQEIPDEMLPEIESDLRTCDDDDDEIYTCFVCRKQLVSQAKMVKHLQLHRVWCVQSPNGPQPDVIDLLYEALHNRNRKSPAALASLNRPSLAVLLGMKPIQNGIDIPVVIPTSCEDDGTLIDCGDSDTTNDAHHVTPNNDITAPNAGDWSSSVSVPSVSPEVLPSMPLDLTDPSTIHGGDKTKAVFTQRSLETHSNTTNDKNLRRESVDTFVNTSKSCTHKSQCPDNQQCSTIDQSALRDLVEALETISSTQLGNQAGGGNPQTGADSNDDLNRRLDALGGSNMVIPPSVQDSSPTEWTTKPSESTSHKGVKVPDTKHNQSCLVCPYCLKIFSSLKDSYLHKIKEHHLVAVFKCISPGCKRTFNKAKDYEDHSLEHAQLAFICRICNEHFCEYQQVISHKSSAHRMIKNGGEKLSALTSGPVKSQTESDSNHDPITPGKSYLCDQCGVTLPSKPMLNRHKLHHSRANDLVCKQCDAVFKNKEHLRRHEKTKHSDERPFKCIHDGCDKAFSRRDKLRDHYKVHTVDKPYVCQYCSKAYRFKDGLKNHELTHQKELKYFCTMCEGAFSKPAMLRAHMSAAHQIDLKKSSYPCHQCGKLYNRPERLKQHMEKAHEKATVWKFNCDICGKGFAGQTSYNTHMNKCHADNTIGIPTESSAAVNHTSSVSFVQTAEAEAEQLQQMDQVNLAQSGSVYVPATSVSSAVGPQLITNGSEAIAMPIQFHVLPQMSQVSNLQTVAIQNDMQQPQVMSSGQEISGSFPSSSSFTKSGDTAANISGARIDTSVNDLMVMGSIANSQNTFIPVQILTSPLTSHVVCSTGQSSLVQNSLTNSISNVLPTSIVSVQSVAVDSGGQNDRIGLQSGNVSSSINANPLNATSMPGSIALQLVVPAAFIQSSSASSATGVPVSIGTSVGSAFWSNPVQNWQSANSENLETVPLQLVTSPVNSSPISLHTQTSNVTDLSSNQLTGLAVHNVPQGGAVSPNVVPTSRVIS